MAPKYQNNSMANSLEIVPPTTPVQLLYNNFPAPLVSCYLTDGATLSLGPNHPSDRDLIHQVLYNWVAFHVVSGLSIESFKNNMLLWFP
ncbi:hypothetical protein JTE90_022507 [Oedothorax gibbosus]|uniref:Uncharacterized protein n=1 Tax=Oedothorax gibbosus TaxID=931172 RepID=A0AAV6UZM5_9ARAC|nr:hypothetical protein JTE90_022507 [Oedothorax gibbosus]